MIKVKMIFVDQVINFDSPYRKDLFAGSSEWSKNQHGEWSVLDFVCPCGCGKTCTINVTDDPNKTNFAWEWDGNLEKPTLKQMIKGLSECGWQGYLTEGYFIQY